MRALFLLTLFLAAPIFGQDYPSKPVRIVNPYQAGGGVDMLARLFASKMQERWSQPVLVESKPGAGGNLGADFVAKSAGDGYTLLLTASTLTTAPYFFSKLPFDVQRDFAPISLVAVQEFFIVASPSFPPNTMAELIAYARANPGKVSYATPGIGTPQHLGGELIRSMTGIDMVHVPYKGQAPAAADLVAGQVHIAWLTLNGALPYIRTGRMKPLAIAAKKRVASLADTPIVAETLPGFEVNTWFALFAPAGTPAPIIDQLVAETHRIARLQDVRERLIPLGYEVVTNTPQELRAAIAAETAKWGKVVRDAGIKPDQ
jgi:tripartite-type tricarboxylate transporter receptor subunit TctC